MATAKRDALTSLLASLGADPARKSEVAVLRHNLEQTHKQCTVQDEQLRDEISRMADLQRRAHAHIQRCATTASETRESLSEHAQRLRQGLEDTHLPRLGEEARQERPTPSLQLHRCFPALRT